MGRLSYITAELQFMWSFDKAVIVIEKCYCLSGRPPALIMSSSHRVGFVDDVFVTLSSFVEIVSGG